MTRYLAPGPLHRFRSVTEPVVDALVILALIGAVVAFVVSPALQDPAMIVSVVIGAVVMAAFALRDRARRLSGPVLMVGGVLGYAAWVGSQFLAAPQTMSNGFRYAVEPLLGVLLPVFFVAYFGALVCLLVGGFVRRAAR